MNTKLTSASTVASGGGWIENRGVKACKQCEDRWRY
jgi:hypothetical protein